MNGATAAAPAPAGFWIRLVAFVIDLLVIMVAQFVLGFAAALRWGAAVEAEDAFQGGVVFFTCVFAVAYPTVLHAITGQTLGQLATRVRVVAVDGGLLPLGAAFLRAMAAWGLLFGTLGLGHVIGGLRKDKRALHDLLAGSRVERLPRATPRRRVTAPPRPAPSPPAAPSPVPPLVPQSPFHRPPGESEPPRSSG